MKLLHETPTRIEEVTLGELPAAQTQHTDPHDVEKLHRDDGFGSGAGVTRDYTDAVRGCLFVDLSVDAGVAAGRAGT